MKDRSKHNLAVATLHRSGSRGTEMKKLALWTAGWLGLAAACGLAGLAHLSATIITATVFCSGTVFLGLAFGWFFRFVWSLPASIAARAEPSSVAVCGKREGTE